MFGGQRVINHMMSVFVCVGWGEDYGGGGGCLCVGGGGGVVVERCLRGEGRLGCLCAFYYHYVRCKDSVPFFDVSKFL